jgi:hypothetical protein
MDDCTISGAEGVGGGDLDLSIIHEAIRESTGSTGTFQDCRAGADTDRERTQGDVSKLSQALDLAAPSPFVPSSKASAASVLTCHDVATDEQQFSEDNEDTTTAEDMSARSSRSSNGAQLSIGDFNMDTHFDRSLALLPSAPEDKPMVVQKSLQKTASFRDDSRSLRRNKSDVVIARTRSATSSGAIGKTPPTARYGNRSCCFCKYY